MNLQVKQFFEVSFLSISSVSTEQWQLYAKNLRAIKIDQWNLRYWWDNQLFLVKLKQKLLSTMKIPWMTKSFGSNTFNKLNRFHQKTKRVNSVRKQDLCVLLKWDSISWPRTLLISDNFAQWLVANTFCLETIQLNKQKDGIKGNIEDWTCIGSHDQFSAPQMWNWNSNWVRESRQFSILGQNFLWNGQIRDRFYSRQHRNSCISTRRASSTNKHKCGCSQVKVKSKTSTESSRWDNINHTPSKQNLASFDLSKKVINLLRHNQTSQREDDGSIEFYKIKFHLRNHHSQIHNWSDDRWKSCLAADGGSKRRYQYCSDNSGTILSRTFWKDSHWSYVTGQCGDWDWNIQLHLPHWMCIQSSFYCQPWIDTWRSRFEQKTDSILLVHWSKRRKSKKFWTYWLLCTTSREIRAQCMEEAPRRGILGWYWSCDPIKEGLTFSQTRSNAIILQGTLTAHCIVKVERLKIGEVLYERRYLSPRPPPKMSLKNNHNWTKGNDQSGSTVEHQPVGKPVQQSFWRVTAC